MRSFSFGASGCLSGVCLCGCCCAYKEEMRYGDFAKDLIRPKRLEFEKLTRVYGKFVVEPLERGYGTTIGNCLRRVLLSSLPGAAVVAVRIAGVRHEFSTVPGCVEDVTEIILNLKQLIVNLHEQNFVTLRLDIAGSREVVAGDIGIVSSVEIVNPEQHICTLNDGASFSAEIDVKVGRGYVSTDTVSSEEELPLGTILVDALFSPVRKVNHFVTNSRLGQRTDYDRLTVEVWTNGSIDPESAIKSASLILRDQLGCFCGDDTSVVSVPENVEKELSKPKWSENLFKRVDELELSVRSSNCLESEDIKYVGELVRRSFTQLLKVRNFGKKSLTEIQQLLSEMGLHLDMKLDGFPTREELDRMTEGSTNSGS